MPSPSLSLIESLVATAISASHDPPPSFPVAPSSPSSIPLGPVNHTIAHAWAVSTRKGYFGGVKRFQLFCQARGIPLEDQLPASGNVLCAFAASSAGVRSGSAVRNDLSGIRAWHILNNVPYNDSIRLSYVVRGVENLTPTSSRRAARRPITSSMMAALHTGLDLVEPGDACIFAAACCAFWGQARSGDILPGSDAVHDPSMFPSTSDLGPPSTAAGSRKLHLPYDKAKKHKGADIILCRQHGPSDPIWALSNHLRVNTPPARAALFSFRAHAGFTTLSSRRLLVRCNTIWSRLGLPSVSGHCFRIGGTTELLLRGVPPDIVRMMGRWSSDAFFIYWRNLELVAPIYAEFLAPKLPPPCAYTKCSRQSLR